MRSSELPVRCPYCTARSVVDCEKPRLRGEQASRLKGTDINCHRCDSEFALYYY